MSKLKKVIFHREDFGVIKAALIHSKEYFRAALLDEDLLPASWKKKDCKNLLKNLEYVENKVDIVLSTQENTLCQKSLDNLIKDLNADEKI